MLLARDYPKMTSRTRDLVKSGRQGRTGRRGFNRKILCAFFVPIFIAKGTNGPLSLGSSTRLAGGFSTAQCAVPFLVLAAKEAWLCEYDRMGWSLRDTDGLAEEGLELDQIYGSGKKKRGEPPGEAGLWNDGKTERVEYN
jgi:hypothetical protein